MGFRKNKNTLNLANYRPNESLSRPEKTKKLTEGVVDYLCRYGYGVQVEFGLERWGKRRLDLAAINLKGTLIGVEVKSGPQDLDADKKWRLYLNYVDRFYFAISQRFWESDKGRILERKARKTGSGILVLSERTGFVYSAVSAKFRTQLDEPTRRQITIKMAWRGTGWSKANRKRRTRRFIEPIDSVDLSPSSTKVVREYSTKGKSNVGKRTNSSTKKQAKAPTSAKKGQRRSTRSTRSTRKRNKRKST